jgi:uncharacterized radical SAM superfamily protein
MEHYLIRWIEQNFKLLYINEKSQNNLCFVSDNDSLKDEFKTTFTSEDFQNFLRAYEKTQIIPENVEDFWQMVRKEQEPLF